MRLRNHSVHLNDRSEPLYQVHVIAGKLERDGDIVHVIASSVDDCSQLLGRLRAESRVSAKRGLSPIVPTFHEPSSKLRA